MTTIRQKYFELKKIQSEYLNENIIKQLLMIVNNINDDFHLLNCFDGECKNIDLLNSYIREILIGKPFQYVIGKANFCGHIFYVDENVLIPRNETEELTGLVIKNIKSLYNRQNVQIFDVCCGSGCIGISLKKAFLESSVYLSDISEKCLSIASKNKNDLGVDVTLLQGDMLQPFIENNLKADVIVCNPPYIPSKDTVHEQTLRYEPHLALFANPDTYFYEELFKNAPKVLNKKGLICLEIGEDMEASLTKLVNKYFPTSKYDFYKDMYSKTRFLIIIREER